MLPLVLYGCASNTITYESFPQSAMVVCNGIQKGYTPLTVFYNDDNRSEVINAPNCKAVWMSGAEAKFGAVTPLRRNGSKEVLQITAERPKKVAGEQTDFQFDYQKKREDQIRREIEREQKLQEDYLQLERDRQEFREEQYRDRKKDKKRPVNIKPTPSTDSKIMVGPSTNTNIGVPPVKRVDTHVTNSPQLDKTSTNFNSSVKIKANTAVGVLKKQ